MMIGAELFRQGPRPRAMSIAGLTNWLFTAVVALSFELVQVALNSICILLNGLIEIRGPLSTILRPVYSDTTQLDVERFVCFSLKYYSNSNSRYKRAFTVIIRREHVVLASACDKKCQKAFASNDLQLNYFIPKFISWEELWTHCGSSILL